MARRTQAKKIATATLSLRISSGSGQATGSCVTKQPGRERHRAGGEERRRSAKNSAQWPIARTRPPPSGEGGARKRSRSTTMLGKIGVAEQDRLAADDGAEGDRRQRFSACRMS